MCYPPEGKVGRKEHWIWDLGVRSSMEVNHMHGAFRLTTFKGPDEESSHRSKATEHVRCLKKKNKNTHTHENEKKKKRKKISFFHDVEYVRDNSHTHTHTHTHTQKDISIIFTQMG